MGINSALGSSALLPAGLGFRNVLINGDFKIWQRTTSSAITAASTTSYYADRWACYKSASGGTISRQTAGLEGFQYCARLQRDSGQTAVGSLNIYQSIETVNSIPLAGKTVTISLWARAGANFSGSSMNVGINTGTGTDQNIYTGYTGNISQLNAYQTITTTWTRYSFSTVLSASATEVGVFVAFIPTGTAGANDYIEITGVQLEQNYQPTPFEQRPIGVELQLCQRYYVRKTATTTAPYTVFGFGQFGGTTTTARAFIPLPVPLRTLPNAIEYGGTLNMNQHYVQNFTATSITSNPNSGTSTMQAEIGMTLSSAGPTAGTYGVFGAGNDSNAYIGFSAEL